MGNKKGKERKFKPSFTKEEDRFFETMIMFAAVEAVGTIVRIRVEKMLNAKKSKKCKSKGKK